MGRRSRWCGGLACALAASGIGATVACSGSSGMSGFASGGDDGGADAGGGGGGGSDASDDVGALTDGSVPDTSMPGKTIFYAHDNTTLYRVNADDPQLAITRVGDFDCVGGSSGAMTDLAVDKDGKLFGVSSTQIFLDMQIKANGVACAGKGVALPANSRFYGATMAPAGTVDPNDEALIVANSDGQLFKVDTTNGTTTQVGTFGKVPANDGNGHTYVNVGKDWELSGDIVFLSNGGSPVGFATVRDCPTVGSTTNCDKVDTLVEIDMTKLRVGNTGSVTKAVRGQVVKAAGCNDPANSAYGSVYGVAAYQGDIIGFSRFRPQGASADLSLVIRINNVDGTACLVADDSAMAMGWAGAGVTTQAPVKPPPPR